MNKILILLLSSVVLSACNTKVQTKIDDTVQYIQEVKETIAPVPTVIKENGLPDKHQIKTSFVPQAPEKNWDQPWQDACEEASLLTVFYYYQNQTPDTATMLSDYQRIFSYESQNNWSHDVNLSQMTLISKDLFNLNSTVIDNPNVEIIKKYLAKDIPVIITANGKTLYQENKHFKSGGPWYHSLVILGYDDNISKFTVHDVGTQFGAYYKYSYSLLLDSIHDLPTSGKKEEIDLGNKNILVLVK